MSQQITLRVRPGEAVRFPNRCVACGQPASERLTIRQRRGQLTRRLDAPLCAACARQLARRSGHEDQLLRTGRLVAAAAGVVFLALAATLIGGPWALRLLLGLAAGGAAAALVWAVFQRRAAAAQLPEARAARDAAQIVDFTWRDMTLAFADEALAAAVSQLNDAPQPDPTAVERPADAAAREESRPEAGEATT